MPSIDRPVDRPLLVLHAGAHKAGSTALQAFFGINRNALLELGIDYTSTLTVRGVRKNGAALLYALTGRCSAKRKKLLTRATQRVETFVPRHPVTLLSEESFLVSVMTGDRAQLFERLGDWVQRVGFVQAKVLVYLRRQDDHLLSAWREGIKEGSFSLGFFEYLESHLVNDDHYFTALRAIENALGRDAVVARRYERGSFVGGDLFRDACDALGIPWQDSFELPEAHQSNLSLTYDATEALRQLNALGIAHPVPWRHLLVEAARTWSAEHPDPADLHLLTPEQRAEIVGRYAEENRRAAQRYLGQDELFCTEIPRTRLWQPDQERIEAVKEYLLEAVAQNLREAQASAGEH